MNIKIFYIVLSILLVIGIISLISFYFINKKKLKIKKESYLESHGSFYKSHKNEIFNTKNINNFSSGFLVGSGKKRNNKLKSLVPKSKYGKISDVEGYLIPKSHILVLGSSGSGKTDTILMPNIILNCMSKDKPNGLVFDPKGEIYTAISPFLKSIGYKVILINLTETTQSHRWNPFQYAIDLVVDHIKYNYLKEMLEFKKINFHIEQLESLIKSKYFEAYTSIEDTAKILIFAVDNEKNIWNNNAKDLFALTSRVLMDSLIKKTKIKLKSLYLEIELSDNLENNIKQILLNKELDSIIRLIFKSLNYKNIINVMSSTTQSNWLIFLDNNNYAANIGMFKSTKDQFASFIMNAAGGTSLLNEPAFIDIVSESDFNYHDLLNENIIIFINIPSNVETRKSLAVILTNQIFNFLEQSAKENKTRKLNKPFYFYLEELGNLPRIDCVSSIITLGRSMNIFGILFVQSIQQIEEKFGREAIPKFWDSTMFKLFLLVQHPEIARVISDMYGEESVRNKDGQLVSKKLLEVNELLKLDKGECLVMEQRKQPLFMRLASIKNYKILSDFEKNKYGDWYLANDSYYSHDRDLDITIYTKKDSSILIENIIDEFVYNDWVEIIINKYCSNFFNKLIIDKYETMNSIFNKLKPNVSNYSIDDYTSNQMQKKALEIIDKHNKNYVDTNITNIQNDLLSNKEKIINLCKESYSTKLKEIESRKLNQNDLLNIHKRKLRKIEKEIVKIYEQEYKEKLPIKQIYKKFN